MPSPSAEGGLRRPELSAWLVLAAGLIATGFATRVAYLDLANRDQARFDEHLETMVSAIDRRMNTYADLLISSRAADIANPEFYTGAVWQRYVDALDVATRYPGSRGTALVLRIDAPGMPTEADLAARLARTGQPHWKVWPKVAGATDRYPLVHFRAYDGTHSVGQGFDYYADPARKAAIDRARDTGLPSLTGRVVPMTMRPAERVPSFIMLLPIYEGGSVPSDLAGRRAKIRGVITTGFRAGELFRDLFGAVGAGQLGWRVYDGDTPEPTQLLVAHDLAPGPALARLEGQRVMTIAGRSWLLDA